MPTTTAQNRQWRHERYAQRVLIGGRWIAPLPSDQHGKPGTYCNHGCRCAECTYAATDYSAFQRRRRRVSLPEPASVPEPVPEPAPPQPAKPVRQRRTPKKTAPQKQIIHQREDPVPPFTRGAAGHVADFAHLEQIKNAYYRPQTIAPIPDQPDTQRHMYDGCEIIVAGDTIVRVGQHEQSTAEPETLAERRKSKHRKHGGAGTMLPTSYDEVIQGLKEAGCEITGEGKHLKVVTPDGQVSTLPRTASDWRAIRNTVSQFRALGIDLRRSS